VGPDLGHQEVLERAAEQLRARTHDAPTRKLGDDPDIEELEPWRRDDAPLRAAPA